ncbi:DUF6350 family protein [Cellulomonas sp. NPDC089187]|uniref:cell division protein PerM n=1 Tax=Cellulomonas sp. NPDC089187 TaxID=3154970 RepID=UPI0034188E10
MSAGTRPPQRGGTTRVLDDRARFAPDLNSAPRWVGGMLAGLQAALLSLLVVVVPAIAAFVATSSAPATDGVPWTQALQIGSGVWLLAHGVPFPTAPSVTLAPLGLTALAVFSCWAAARRSGYATWRSYLAGIGAYTLLLALVVLLAGAPLLHLGIGIIGAITVSGLGLGAGLLRRPEAPRLSTLVLPVRSRLPEPVAQGLGAGAVALFTLLAMSALLTIGWVLTGRTTIAEVVSGLGLDAVGGIVLALGELAYLPTLVLWAMSWLSGPGFAVGVDTAFTVDHATTGALPAIPILGALPAPDLTGGVLRFVPVLTVLTAVVAVFWLRRRLTSTRAWDPIIAGAVASAVAGLGAGVLAALAAGGIGPGRMTEFGPAPLLVGLAVAAGTGVAMLLVLLPADRLVRAAVARRARGLWRRMRGYRPGTGRTSDAVPSERESDDEG